MSTIFTERLHGVTRKECHLDYLFDCKVPAASIIIRTTAAQHYAIADYGGSHRLMHRVTVNGDKPAIARKRANRPNILVRTLRFRLP